MKKLLTLVLLLVGLTVFSQTVSKYRVYNPGPNYKPESTTTTPVTSPKSTVVTSENDYYSEGATELLLQEVNVYRKTKNLTPYVYSNTPQFYAKRWGSYMMSQHKNYTNNFYKHNKFGPMEYRNEQSNGEIIHLLYFLTKPTNEEIVNGLMYGIERNSPVIGWIGSPGHNALLLDKTLVYYGASVYCSFKDGYWVVYGTVNFTFVK